MNIGAYGRDGIPGMYADLCKWVPPIIKSQT